MDNTHLLNDTEDRKVDILYVLIGNPRTVTVLDLHLALIFD